MCVHFYITAVMKHAYVWAQWSGVVKCPDRPASRGQVELCSSLLSTPLPLLALVCTLDCNSASLVQLRFSSACERDRAGATGRNRDGKEMRLVSVGTLVGKKKMLKLYLWRVKATPIRKKGQIRRVIVSHTDERQANLLWHKWLVAILMTLW